MSFEIYSSLAPRGWLLTDECDSLLWSCLQAVVLNQPFEVERAYWDSKWHRKPAIFGDCSSTISRDMFLGLFCYCLHFRRLDILDEIWHYGWAHNWKMGQETKYYEKFGFKIPDNRTWFTPGMISLLAQLRAHLRGEKSLWRYLPDPLDTTPGYRSHLTMLKCYLHLRMYGELGRKHKSALQKMLGHSQMNPLVHALLGNKNMANMLLSRYWPWDRLPTNRDWEQPWRIQRNDASNDLIPVLDGPEVIHPGGDLLFVRHVLEIQGYG